MVQCVKMSPIYLFVVAFREFYASITSDCFNFHYCHVIVVLYKKTEPWILVPLSKKFTDRAVTNQNLNKRKQQVILFIWTRTTWLSFIIEGQLFYEVPEKGNRIYIPTLRPQGENKNKTERKNA